MDKKIKYKQSIKAIETLVKKNNISEEELNKLSTKNNNIQVGKIVFLPNNNSTQNSNMHNNNLIHSLDEPLLSDDEVRAVVNDCNKEEQIFKDKAFNHTFGNGKYSKLVKFCHKIKTNCKEIIQDIFDNNCEY